MKEHECDDCHELTKHYMRVTGTGTGAHLSEGNTYTSCDDCFDEYWCCEEGFKNFFDVGESHPQERMTG